MLSKTIGSRTLQIATDTDHLNDSRRKESEERRPESQSGEESGRKAAAEAEEAEAPSQRPSGESLQSVLSWARRQIN